MSAHPASQLGFRLRALETADDSTLEEATLVNVNWREQRFSLHDVRSDPRLSHYTRLDAARGDFGLVAEIGEVWHGVVWLLFLPNTDPGYGFVSALIPELSVCVRAGSRRRGLGRELMSHALDDAVRRGVGAISLSVEEGNEARALYTSLGFLDNPDATFGGTMLKCL